MGHVGYPCPMSHVSSQGRRWCLTLYTDADLNSLVEDAGKVAFVCAEEEGTQEKNRHYQIYVKYETNRRWSYFKKLFQCDGGSYSAHWELANGPEWKCRRYIVDVAAYLRDEPGAHPKTQGRVMHDYGCDVMVDEKAPTDVKVVKMLVDGARLSQVFRTHPVYFFHNSRKISDLKGHLDSWKECGDDFKPSEYEPTIKRPRV